MMLKLFQKIATLHSCLRISLKNIKPPRGLWVFPWQTFSGVLIPHIHLMEIESKVQPPQASLSHLILFSRLRISWRFSGEVCSPPPPELASTSAMMCLSSREPRSSSTAPASIFHFHRNSYSHMDQFLTYPRLMLQAWTFEPVTVCLAA